MTHSPGELSDAMAAARLLAAHKAPYLASALYSLVPVKTELIDRIGVDKHYRCYYNAEYADSIDVDILAGLLIHEITHLVRKHPRRAQMMGIPEDDQNLHLLANIATDIAINTDMRDEGLKLPDDVIYPETYGLTPGLAFEEYYTILLTKQQEQEKQPGGQGQGQGQGKGDEQGNGQGKGQPGDGQGKGKGQQPDQNQQGQGQGNGQQKQDDQGGGSGQSQDKQDGSGDGQDQDGGSESNRNQQQSPPGNDQNQGDGQGSGNGQGDESAPGQNPGSSPNQPGPAGGGQNPTSGAGEQPGQGEQQHHTAPAAGNCGSAAHGQQEPWELGEPQESNVEGLNETEQDLVSVEVAQQIEAMRQRGTVPAGWQRFAQDLLGKRFDVAREAKAVAKRALTEMTVGQVNHSYRKPNRRQAAYGNVVMPRMVGYQPNITVILDTSGSVDDKMLGIYILGLKSVLREHKHNLRVMSVDAKVHNYQKVFNVKQVNILGGGGTDMRVGIARAMEEKPRPDIIFVLTDGYTPWPEEPLGHGTKLVIFLLADGDRWHPTPAWAKTVRRPDLAA